MAKNAYDQLDYFKILNADIDTPDDILRQNYRELAKFWHPDHNKDSNAIDMFQKISVAYDILKDADSRLKYIILSMIYEKKNFPDMNALALLFNMHGQQDVNIRAIHMTEITGKGLTHQSIDKIYYCNPGEAVSVVKSITKHNWFYGFWGITAFFINIRAILQNIFRINSRRENLQLLMHNALVYAEENKPREAYTSALLARNYASLEEKKYIDLFIKKFQSVTPLTVIKWKFFELIKIQLLYPLVFFVFLFGALFLYNNSTNSVPRFANSSVKEVVVFNNGQKMYSDVAVTRIIDLPVDIHDIKRLYHTTTKTKAMHGADKSFDVYKIVEKGTTVRITGYTADQKWLRVMFDNGEMAFIEANKLEQGIGNKIPLWSKIYKEN